MNIKNVVIIGSGTMGGGIAAQLCNANIPVTLLDLETEISEKAKKKIFECATFKNECVRRSTSMRHRFMLM